MAEKIGHASGDEHKKLHGGNAGDQTGREVFTRDWYNRPWNCVIEFIDANMAEKNAVAMEHACKNDNIGYNQYQRNTLLVEARKHNYDPGKVTKKVETDCSALVALCCMYAGIPESCLVVGGNSAYTGNIRHLLEKTGKVKVYTDKKHITSGHYNHRGAILLYEGHHVAIQLEDGSEVKKNKATTSEKEQTNNADARTNNSNPYMIEITTRAINVRKNAGIEYDVVAVFNQGDICSVSKTKNGWGYVNNIGWMSLNPNYSKDIHSFTGKVSAGLLNVRDKASTDGNVIKTIKKGTTLNIIKLNNNATWGYDDKNSGWVSLKYVTY